MRRLGTIEAKLAVAVAIVAGLLGISGLQFHHDFAAYNEAVELRRQTQSRIVSLLEVISNVQDAEAGQRGYLITGRKAYLEPYRNALTDIAGNLEAMRAAFADRPGAAADIARVEDIVARRLASLGSTIEAYDRAGFEAATRLVLGDQGRQMMEELRRIAAGIEAEEANSLADSARLARDLSATSTRRWVSTAAITVVLVVLMAVFVVREVRENRRLAAQLRHEVQHDSLTDLPNRAFLRATLGHTLARARRQGHKVAMVFLDLDGFKEINDRHGHEVGDVVLRQVARTLQVAVRKGDIVTRLGGDEFVVLVPVVEHRSEIDGLIERLDQSIATTVVPIRDGGPVRASMGMALFPDDASTEEELLAVADQRMYASKRGAQDVGTNLQRPVPAAT